MYFPDAGVFWYHPHVREDYTQEMGLYGNFIVRSSAKDFLEPVNNEIFLTLDDILIGRNIEPFYKNYTNYAAMGRFGNVMILNGSDHYFADANKGDIVRFYITNTANTRTFNLKIPGTKIKLIAGDASKFEKETWVDNTVIAPSERYVIDVLLEKSGSFNLENSINKKNINLGLINVSEKIATISFKDKFNILHEDKILISEIDKLRPYFEKPADKNLTLSVKMDMNMEHDCTGYSAIGES